MVIILTLVNRMLCSKRKGVPFGTPFLLFILILIENVYLPALLDGGS